MASQEPRSSIEAFPYLDTPLSLHVNLRPSIESKILHSQCHLRGSLVEKHSLGKIELDRYFTLIKIKEDQALC